MKLSKSKIDYFQKTLLDFFSTFKSNKPWQIDNDPYKIWVFEVVMQQTRMDQGVPYYERIIAEFPTISKLAESSEDALFELWKGLGYYSRARNLHFTAKYITSELKGEFPKTYVELLKLKGIGEYTAAAIASFAYNENLAVLDGNVHRVLSRIFGIDRTIQSSIDKKKFLELANQLLIKGSASIFNQAMMNLGSYQCKPVNPNCDDCLFSPQCHAYTENKVAELPPKKIRPTLKVRHFYCLFLEHKGKIYLEKRLENDIWKGLYQGIVQEGKEIDMEFWKNNEIDVASVNWGEWQVQTLSHQKIWMKMAKLRISKRHPLKTSLQLKTLKNTIAFPRLISRWWESQLSS